MHEDRVFLHGKVTVSSSPNAAYFGHEHQEVSTRWSITVHDTICLYKDGSIVAFRRTGASTTGTKSSVLAVFRVEYRSCRIYSTMLYTPEILPGPEQ